MQKETKCKTRRTSITLTDEKYQKFSVIAQVVYPKSSMTNALNEAVDLFIEKHQHKVTELFETEE